MLPLMHVLVSSNTPLQHCIWVYRQARAECSDCETNQSYGINQDSRVLLLSESPLTGSDRLKDVGHSRGDSPAVTDVQCMS